MHPHTIRDIASFDATHRDSLNRLWFLGDVHGDFRHIGLALSRVRPEVMPRWLVFLGDLEIFDRGLGEIIAPLLELDGVRVAGMGGNFLGRVWAPPSAPAFASRAEATYRHPNLVKRDQQHAPCLHAAIYKDEVDALASQQADILITHEAFSCHHHGWEALDQLARDLQVARAFHGHTHDDRTDEYRAHLARLRFEAVGVNFRCIKNGLGELVFNYGASAS